ncbi:sigma-70 family RNA polymerase sigma factor [Thermopolyspora sp. NPDC052614]|uniref:sigma-70 family RNA polymerase sigma factor n=1 Tax=Thermopolyspora sp. NPDC052614 TaxID=3155682 RepID=UPI003437AFB8
MDEKELLASRFADHRDHLTAVAYRMLGSLSEAEDAVQEAWLRLSRSDADAIENLRAWLTTVVGRVCLDMLRSRAARREEPLPEVRLPDPIVADGPDPERQALIADSVGLALVVVLQTLSPAERLAFVLHDLFGVPFDEIAPIVGRTPATAKKLASRARQRVRGAAPAPDTDLAGQRRVVEAFLTAARGGDFEALLAVLDPDVELRVDAGPAAAGVRARGAATVARSAIVGARAADRVRHVVVNGVAGLVESSAGRPVGVLAFTIRNGRVATIDILTDPVRLARLDPALFEE